MSELDEAAFTAALDTFTSMSTTGRQNDPDYRELVELRLRAAVLVYLDGTTEAPTTVLTDDEAHAVVRALMGNTFNIDGVESAMRKLESQLGRVAASRRKGSAP